MEEVLAKLLTDVKSGDADAFERLSMRYAPLIDSLLRRYLNDRRFDIEDFRQEAEIALYSAACAYNCRQNKVTFGLFVFSQVIRFISEFFHMRRTPSARPQTSAPVHSAATPRGCTACESAAGCG